MKKFLILLLCLSTLASIVACGNSKDNKDSVLESSSYSQSSSESVQDSSSEPIEPEYTLSVSVDATDIASYNARVYLFLPDGTSISDVIVGGAGRSDLGLAVVIKCESNAEIISGTVEIKEVGSNEEFTLNLRNKKVSVYNLKTATEYEYHLSVTTEKNGVMEEDGRFVTEDTVRFLNIENLVNARDIGNRKTEDGKIIRQGLLYRGSELDGLVEKAYCLTEDGKEAMLDVLKIRTLLDLRNPNKTANDSGTLKVKDGMERPSPLGEITTRLFFDAAQYDACFNANGMEKTRLLFSELAKKENYPIYLHCTYGCDRTGTACLLLDGLLGCSKETAIKNYELSALYKDFPHINRNNSSLIKFFNQLDDLYVAAGESYSAKVEAYLLDCGVTSEQIANIRDIFLDE